MEMITNMMMYLRIMKIVGKPAFLKLKGRYYPNPAAVAMGRCPT
jgi:hypothetical protein